MQKNKMQNFLKSNEIEDKIRTKNVKTNPKKTLSSIFTQNLIIKWQNINMNKLENSLDFLDDGIVDQDIPNIN